MSTEARKDDAGKARLDLLPFEALDEVGKVLEFGARKYAAHNWRAGFQWSRPQAAMLRHMFAFARGEDNDPETGLSHLAHAACNVLFLLTSVLEKSGVDDRYKQPQERPAATLEGDGTGVALRPLPGFAYGPAATALPIQTGEATELVREGNETVRGEVVASTGMLFDRDPPTDEEREQARAFILRSTSP